MSEEEYKVPARNEYPWSVKTEVVTRYMSVGNMRLVSEVMNLPYTTIIEWKRQPWWSELVEELRKAKRSKTNNKITKIIEDSLELIEDRLENGDFILNNKTGAIERKPVPLRDVANVTNQLLTRQLQLEELADKMEHRNETVQETLKLLAGEFSKWQRIQNKNNATTVEVINGTDSSTTFSQDEGNQSESLFEENGQFEEEKSFNNDSGIT